MASAAAEDVTPDTVRLAQGTNPPRASASKRKVVKVGLALVLMCCFAGAVAVAVLSFGKTGKTGIDMPSRLTASYTMRRTADSDFKYEGRFHKEANDADGKWQVELDVTYYNPKTKDTSRIVVLDGRAYYQSTHEGETTPYVSECYPEQYIPPLADIDDIVRNAAEVPAEAVTSVAGSCPDGTARYAVQWGTDPGDQENTFFYCQHEGVHYITNTMFEAQVWNLESDPEANGLGLTVPLDLETGEPLECPELPRTLSALNDAVEEQRAASQEVASRLLRGSTASEPVRRQLSGRHCYFMHSFGNDDNKKTSGSWSSYWGDVDDVVGSGCSKTKFIKMDVIDAGWDDPSVLNELCDELAGGHSGDVISNRIVFTHGYGSLALAAAMYSSRCSLASTSDWYSVGAPWDGADAATAASTLCANNNPALSDAFDQLGMCQTSNTATAVSAGCASLATTYTSAIVTFAQLKAFAMTKLSGAMCGYTSVGEPLQTLDDYVDFSGEEAGDVASYLTDDGFVHVDSCKGTATFGAQYTNTNAALFVNHLGLTCRNDDPVLDILKAASPCKWYKYRTT